MIEVGQFYTIYTKINVREGRLNGTKYYVVRLGRRIGVIVQCPKCRRFGRLVIRRRGFLGTTFYVKHDKNERDYCTISAAEPGNSILEEIYRKEVTRDVFKEVDSDEMSSLR